ncbi:MAG: S8 family serine peptidase [Euryarchaeota archaeon]|nr:S8 family serine peptidase [Euryarchaeota archaeon]
MKGLDKLELLPEPEDSRILSAIDPSAVGFQDGWRAEVTGWAPREAAPIVRLRRRKFLATNGVIFAILVIVLLSVWNSGLLFIELSPPKSEWANEQSQVADFSELELTGSGVKVCMVDTGLDLSNPAFTGLQVTFKDMVGSSSSPIDYGFIAHGTLMAGILVSGSHQQGIAPGISLAMVAALGADENDMNSGSEQKVADAIQWCQDEFQADIISLSLGGEQNIEMMNEGSSVSAVRRAVDSGIFVVAAAGNDGGPEDDGLVSVPGNVPRVITVGASTQEQTVWENSSAGSQILSNGSMRQNPHMKPEVVAPGENIISTGIGDSWYSSSGTSDSTVFVTGALSLILEAFPEYKPTSSSNGECIDQVKISLMNTSLKYDDSITHSNQWGYGQLQAYDWYQELATLAPTC